MPEEPTLKPIPEKDADTGLTHQHFVEDLRKAASACLQLDVVEPNRVSFQFNAKAFLHQIEQIKEKYEDANAEPAPCAGCDLIPVNVCWGCWHCLYCCTCESGWKR